MPNVGEAYLSVHSLEIDKLAVIADQYRNHFQSGTGKVAVACLQVVAYNRACESGGVHITYSRERNSWTFIKHGAAVDAYQLHSNRQFRSHCGVEAVCLMDQIAASKFARRLAGRPPGRNPHWL